jgi:hypothetical protein
MAAYTAKKMGKSVLLIEPGRHLGGLTSGGLGYTDIGNKYAITGLALDYYRRLGNHYGKFEQWVFEPGVAENLFRDYVKRAGVEVLFDHCLAGASKDANGYLQTIALENVAGALVGSNRTVKAGMFIDATYEGDLMARAGVSYIVGREDNSLYQETLNGVQFHDKHQFPDGVDPYNIPGSPESGLVWGISSESLPPNGTGDKKVQAYNFRICLTDHPANRIPITRPRNYDSTRYELVLRQIAKRPAKNLNGVMKIDHMPNRKTDINNNGGFSTDMVGMNYNYPEADYATRRKIQQEHEDYNKGFLYFLGHDPRVPEPLRREMNQWGYPKDEYTDNSNWSLQMYVREARRMVGAYVMTQHNCQGRKVVEDGVGMAAYTMDSHNCQRVVVNGMVKNEGDVQVGGFGPYPISYRSLIPKESECKNLLVPVCLSASHIAYGSIRMEPVFMVLAQSAAVAACLALDAKTSVQGVNVKAVQAELKNNPLADKSLPEIRIDNEDALYVQKTGEWQQDNKAGGRFGPSLLRDDSRGATPKSVRFTPDVRKAGKYQVYVYFPKVADASAVTTITLHNGKQAKDMTLRKESLQVEGQTAGAWVPLGEYNMATGRKGYVEISNKGADGVVVADAVLFVPVR